MDVASFGDAHGAADGCLDVVYSDSRSGIYKKLVVGPEGELLGGILVGDAEAYGTLRAADRFGAAGGARAAGAARRRGGAGGARPVGAARTTR